MLDKKQDRNFEDTNRIYHPNNSKVFLSVLEGIRDKNCLNCCLILYLSVTFNVSPQDDVPITWIIRRVMGQTLALPLEQV